MPFPIPTLDDLRTRTRASFATRLPGADTALPVSFLGVNADTISAEDYAEYRALVWLANQLFIDSCDGPYLDRYGSQYNLPREPASIAAGPVTFTGTNGIPPIPAGTLIQTQDGTVGYVTQAAATIVSGTATVGIVATVGGAAGNQVTGASLPLSSAIAGVQPSVTVASPGLTGGADAESDPDYEIRLLARIQTPPQGGAATDFVAWAKAAYPGVTRAWVYPNNRGRGTVDVLFTMDGRANNIPLSPDIAAVQAGIMTVQPVVGDVLVAAPLTQTVTIGITGMVPNDATTQANVRAQLAALIATVAPGGATVGDGVSAAVPGGSLYLSQIEAAVYAAGNVVHFDLTAPTADIFFESQGIPELGSVTFA